MKPCVALGSASYVRIRASKRAAKATGFVGSIIAQQSLSSMGDDAFGEGDTSEQSGNDETDNTGDDSGDYGSDDYGSGDFGGFWGVSDDSRS